MLLFLNSVESIHIFLSTPICNKMASPTRFGKPGWSGSDKVIFDLLSDSCWYWTYLESINMGFDGLMGWSNYRNQIMLVRILMNFGPIWI
jgi:hypothetical protein